MYLRWHESQFEISQSLENALICHAVHCSYTIHFCIFTSVNLVTRLSYELGRVFPTPIYTSRLQGKVVYLEIQAVNRLQM